MAERIIPCMEIYAEKDYRTFDTYLSARIRVAVPDEPIERAVQKAIAVNAETVKGEKV